MSTPLLSQDLPPDASTLLRYQSAMDFVYQRLNYEHTPDAAQSLADFKLTRMVELLAALGDPHLTVPTVHVTGSKGKGSTSTMVARMGEAAGYRVGLFTSPHMTCFEERFTINSRSPSKQQVADLVDRVRPAAEKICEASPGGGPTFFELATAMGWLYFAEQKVDLAVIEVGLGGRLDSTNVCQPLVTAITSISRDHVRLLGDTLESIAREKAGIAKSGVPMVSGVTQAGPAAAISDVTQSAHAPLLTLNQDFQVTHLEEAQTDSSLPACYRFDFQNNTESIHGLQLSMPGEHQTRNAAIAVQIALLLKEKGFRFNEDAIRSGLANACCPLRVEVVSQNPTIIVDAAHNPASITALCETTQRIASRPRIAVFAASRDKECTLLLKAMNEGFDQIILTRFGNNPRSSLIEELQQVASEALTIPWSLAEQTATALQQACELAGNSGLICVTGSFFLAAEAKELLEKQKLSESPSTN